MVTQLFDELDEDSSGDLDKTEVLKHLVDYGYNGTSHDFFLPLCVVRPRARVCGMPAQLTDGAPPAIDAEAASLLARMDADQGTVSKEKFREVYAIFITDMAQRGHDIAKRERDRVLEKRGLKASDVELFVHEFVWEESGHLMHEIICEQLVGAAANGHRCTTPACYFSH